MITKYFSVIFALLLTSSMIAGSQSAFAGDPTTCEETCQDTFVAGNNACTSLQGTRTNTCNTIQGIRDAQCRSIFDAQARLFCLLASAQNGDNCRDAAVEAGNDCREPLRGILNICLQACNAEVGGEIIGVQSSALLVAGAYTTSAWLIPVLVSAVGIGLVALRRQ